MTAPSHATVADQTELPLIVRASIKQGLIQTAIIVLIGLVSKYLDGPVETAGIAVLLVFGLAASAGLPGIWTNARTIEGIAGAAGIGLAASAVFLVLDVSILQPVVHLWTNRWREIGGGSNWWYHPVWWMLDAYLAWMGAWVLANQAAKGQRPSLAGLLALSLGLTLVLGVIAVLAHFPLAGWNVPTFGVAYIAGLTLAVPVSGFGAKKG
ncbi:MAG TPA: hypothetical protein VFI13_08690 [Gemmatimonadales bacterium]|nr:hypothetical protein [Gemmatimonadales bacterium]